MRYLHILILFLFVTTSVSLGYDNVNLSELDKNLTNAPYVVKYKFEKKYNKDWSNSTLKQRQKFLLKFNNEQDMQRKKDLREARDQAKKERAARKEILAQNKMVKSILKGYEKERKDDQKQAQKSKRNLNKRINNQVKELTKSHK